MGTTNRPMRKKILPDRQNSGEVPQPDPFMNHSLLGQHGAIRMRVAFSDWNFPNTAGIRTGGGGHNTWRTASSEQVRPLRPPHLLRKKKRQVFAFSLEAKRFTHGTPPPSRYHLEDALVQNPVALPQHPGSVPPFKRTAERDRTLPSAHLRMVPVRTHRDWVLVPPCLLMMATAEELFEWNRRCCP